MMVLPMAGAASPPHDAGVLVSGWDSGRRLALPDNPATRQRVVSARVTGGQAGCPVGMAGGQMTRPEVFQA